MQFCKEMISTAVVLALLATAPPGIAAADDPATRYEECMNKAEADLYKCLRIAAGSEYLCWSRYGYAKSWCSVRYLMESIFE